MKNDEIIKAIAIEIWGEEEINRMQEDGKTIPLHTMSVWAQIHPDAKPKKSAKGHKAMLWKVNPKTGKIYRNKSILYTEEELDF